MPKECSLCIHSQREEINKVLQAKTSNRDVARKYAVSKSAVDRHRRNCLPGIKVRAREIRAVERNVALVSAEDRSPFIHRVEDHTTKLEMLRDAALRKNDDKTAIAAAREVRGAYEVLGKATGKFQPMFGDRESQPMFVLPPGCNVAVTFNQAPQPLESDVRDITPVESIEQFLPAETETGEAE